MGNHRSAPGRNGLASTIFFTWMSPMKRRTSSRIRWSGLRKKQVRTLGRSAVFQQPRSPFCRTRSTLPSSSCDENFRSHVSPPLFTETCAGLMCRWNWTVWTCTSMPTAIRAGPNARVSMSLLTTACLRPIVGLRNSQTVRQKRQPPWDRCSAPDSASKCPSLQIGPFGADLL